MESNTELFFVGSYTHPLPHVPESIGRGVSKCELDLESGQISVLSHDNSLINPSYLYRHKNFLYAISEEPKKAILQRFIVKEEGFTLGESLQSSLNTSGCCHVVADDDGLYISSYHQGMSIHLEADDHGDLCTQTYSQYEGKGPNMSRQQTSHIHQTVLSPNGQHAYHVDLGADVVRGFARKKKSSEITLSLTPGCGPRHMVFHPQEPLVYIWCELKPLLLCCLYNEQDGSLETLSSLSLDQIDGHAPMNGAAIKVHPSGQTLYASERSCHSILSFDLSDPRNPKQIQMIKMGGLTPRDFAISTSGGWMVIAFQDSHELITMALDDKGHPKPEVPFSSIPLGTPVCVCF